MKNSFAKISTEDTSVIRKIYIQLSSVWRKIPLLDRWILGELITPLIFSIAAFTVVSLSVGVMFDLVRKIVNLGLPFHIALQVLFLRLPGFVVISFPMAVLMSTLLAYSRLSENSELKALRSIGVNTFRLILPAISISLFMTFLTFTFNNNIVPHSNRSAEYILQNSLRGSFSFKEGDDIIYVGKGRIKDDSGKTIKKGLTHLFYSWRYRDGQMIDVTVLDFSENGNKQVLLADKAVWNNASGKWNFKKGRLINLSLNGDITNTDFENYIYPFGLEPVKVAELPKDSNDMTIGEAIKAEKLYKSTGNEKESRRLQVRIQEKFTLPMACIVFGLIGSCLGARPHTISSRSQGFGLSIILILSYYVLSFLFSSLGVGGTIAPLIAAWMPVFISLSGGAILLKQASR